MRGVSPDFVSSVDGQLLRPPLQIAEGLEGLDKHDLERLGLLWLAATELSVGYVVNTRWHPGRGWMADTRTRRHRRLCRCGHCPTRRILQTTGAATPLELLERVCADLRASRAERPSP